MRHTLLPLNERKTLQREYKIRLVIVLCFLLSIAGLIGITALFPAYIHARDLEQSELGKATLIKNSKDAQGRSAIETELRADELILSKLSKDVMNYRASSAIQSIIAARGQNNFTYFSYSQSGTSTAMVVLQGKAPTRDELLSLKNRLLNILPQSKVDLPLSELARSKDIDFSMRLTYKLP